MVKAILRKEKNKKQLETMLHGFKLYYNALEILLFLAHYIQFNYLWNIETFYIFPLVHISKKQSDGRDV